MKNLRVKLLITGLVITMSTAVYAIGENNKISESKEPIVTVAAEDMTYIGLDLGSDYMLAKTIRSDVALRPVSRGSYLKGNTNNQPKEEKITDENIIDLREPEESEFKLAVEEVEENIRFEEAVEEVEVAYNGEFERYAMHDIPMPVKHQKFLFQLCKENNLDYIKTLAIVKHESQFKSDLVHSNKNGTKDYGYMQINTVNRKNYSQTLGVADNPLDPYINLRMGVHALSTLKGGYEHQGQSGRQLFESVQSAYNKGVYGYKKHGKATRYIQRTDNELKWLNEKLGL